jgi:hypothetical protein
LYNANIKYAAVKSKQERRQIKLLKKAGCAFLLVILSPQFKSGYIPFISLSRNFNFSLSRFNITPLCIFPTKCHEAEKFKVHLSLYNHARKPFIRATSIPMWNSDQNSTLG